MIVENNWVTTNINQRLVDKNVDFDVNIVPYAYTKTDFKTACISVANKIAALNRPIYIAFSGGADSEYVVRVFKELKIPFTALTVKTVGNKYELMYANLLYKEYPDINKVIIDYTKNVDYIKKYASIVKNLRTNALNSVPLVITAEYVKKENNNGILVSADHIFECGYDKTTNVMLSGFSEWDFYTDVLVDDNLLLPFYLYDINIVNSMVEMSNEMSVENFKHMMYGTLFRPKFSYHFEPKYYEFQKKIRNKIKKFPRPQKTYNKNQFLNIINKKQ